MYQNGEMKGELSDTTSMNDSTLNELCKNDGLHLPGGVHL